MSDLSSSDRYLPGSRWLCKSSRSPLLLPVLVGGLAWLTGLAFAGPLHAQDYWNQFRGPNGDGVSQAENLPETFADSGENLIWKTPLDGRAWSSPVVWGNQVWLTNAPEIQNPEGLSAFDVFPKELPPPADPPIRLSAVCLDLTTGQKIHDVTVFELTHPQFVHETNSYASPTPVIEKGRLYVHFGAHGTACLDTETGRKIWERTDFECHHFRGAGSSPILFEDRLILTFDGFDKQFQVALDKETGETIWRNNRDITFENDYGDYHKAYATPTIVMVEDQPVLVSPHANATSAYDPRSGELIWRVFHGGMNAAARPITGNGLVFVNAGDGRDTMIAIDPTGKGDVSDSHIRWRTGRMSPKRPSQLFYKGHLYLLEDKGVVACLDPETGEVLGSNRVGGNYWASPIIAAGRIYICSQEGKIAVLNADPNLDVMATSTLDDGIIASPAVAEDSLLIRTKSHLYRFGKR